MSSEELFIKFKNDIISQMDSWENKEDIYVISIWVDYLDDDVRLAQAIVGYNTLSQVEEEKQNASSFQEAKWNFAFWIQNEEVVFGGEDEEFQEWFVESKYNFSEDLAEKELDVKRADYQDFFIDNIKKVVKELFSEGHISKYFGKKIPILIHELEYYGEIREWNREVNPKELLVEFEKEIFE